MGVVIKQSFWSTIISYIGVIVGYVNVLYFRAEYFDLTQIGIFALVTSNAMIVCPLASFGMDSTYLKYFSAFQKDDRNRFFTFLFLFAVVGNAAVLLLGFLMKDVIAARYVETAPDYIPYLSITAIIIVTSTLFELLFSYSSTIMKVIFPSFLREICLKSGSLFLVFGYAFKWWDFPATIMGLGLIYVFAFLFLFFHLIQYHNFRFSFRFGIITKEWKIKFLKFGLYSMATGASYGILHNISFDQITSILGADMTGIFASCFLIAAIIEIPKRNMAKVVTPIISQELEQGNMKEVSKLYSRSSITLSVIGLLLFIGVTTNLQDLFEIIPKGAYFKQGSWVVIGVCFVRLSTMVASFSGEIVNFSPHYRYNLLFQVISATILIILNYFLIQKWGLNGAAISLFLSLLIYVVIKVIFVKIRFGIHPFIPSHIPLLFIGIVVTTGAYYFQPAIHPALNIVIRSILTTIVFLFLIYKFHISSDINKIIHSTFERFSKK